MSIATGRRSKRQGKKLLKGSKYSHQVATTLTGLIAEKGRKLRDEHAIGLATLVRSAVIASITDHYSRVESGLGAELKSQAGLATAKAKHLPKLNVATQVDKRTFILLRRLKNKTAACTAKLIRQPVCDEISKCYERIVA